MSGQQQRDKGSLEQQMEDAPTGSQIDSQEAANTINSGSVEAEEQSTPQDETRPGNATPDKPADRPA
jgi:hypothetical protein